MSPKVPIQLISTEGVYGAEKLQDAWLVTAGDVAALTAALAEALGDSARAQARAASAYQSFLLEYSGDTMGQRYLRMYESIWTARGWN